MTANGGSENNHDKEFDIVKWISLHQALNALTYKGEVNILEKAAHIIDKKKTTEAIF